MESGTRLHSLQIPSSKYQVEPWAFNMEMMYEGRLHLESTNHIQLGLFYFYLLFFLLFLKMSLPQFFSLKKNSCVIKYCGSVLDFKGLFYLLYSTASLFICPISFAIWQNHVMELEKTEPQHFPLLADCIKETRGMVSQGYIHPVFCAFFFFLNVAKMR